MIVVYHIAFDSFKPLGINMIIIHTHSLAQLLQKNKADFADLRSFNQYKKQQIYMQRNQYLSDVLQKSIYQTDLAITEYGKPYLKNDLRLAFNHSHSQKNYALALSQTYLDIGIDVEDLDRKVRFQALAEHAFHPRELAEWHALEQDSSYWFKVWTTKEAVLKASGLGIRLTLNEFDTGVRGHLNSGVCEHSILGSFAYQHEKFEHMLLTIAWRITDKNSTELVKINIFQH